MNGRQSAKPRGQQVLKVLGLGDAGIDLMMRVPGIPCRDEKVMGASVGRFPGGMVANFLCCLSSLGTSSGFWGCIGNDSFGDVCRQALALRDVDLSRLIVKEGEATYWCVSLIQPDGEKALIIGATPTIFPEAADLDPSALEGVSLLHTTGLCVEAALKAMRLARRGGAEISLDLEPSALDQGDEAVRQLLALTDILFLNQQAQQRMFQAGETAPEAGKRLMQSGPRIVVLTCGGEGAVVCSPSASFTSLAFDVRVVDTTGAGDCFAAAFIHGYLKEWPLREIARFANAVAAISITAFGAQSCLPTEEEVEDFLEGAAVRVPSASRSPKESHFEPASPELP